MDLSNFLIVIPARAGSKRFKGKNRAILDNKPLICHSIEYAQNLGNIDIVISTNDSLIKPIAEKYNVPLIWRSEQLSTDYTPTIDVLLDAINKVDKKYKYIILLQPTNPLRPKNIFDDCLDMLNKNKHDSIITVSKNSLKYGKIVNGIFKPLNYGFGQRSQDLDSLFFENGLLYIIPTNILEKNTIMSENPQALIVNHPFASVDIDYEEDLMWAEYLLKKYPNESV